MRGILNDGAGGKKSDKSELVKRYQQVDTDVVITINQLLLWITRIYEAEKNYKFESRYCSFHYLLSHGLPFYLHV